MNNYRFLKKNKCNLLCVWKKNPHTWKYDRVNIYIGLSLNFVGKQYITQYVTLKKHTIVLTLDNFIPINCVWFLNSLVNATTTKHCKKYVSWQRQLLSTFLEEANIWKYQYLSILRNKYILMYSSSFINIFFFCGENKDILKRLPFLHLLCISWIYIYCIYELFKRILRK